MTKLIVPQWPMPGSVAACSSTRIGGVSLPPYDSLNLGAHCGDNLQDVEENRRRMFAAGGFAVLPGLAGAGPWHRGSDAGRRTLSVETRGCLL